MNVRQMVEQSAHEFGAEYYKIHTTTEIEPHGEVVLFTLKTDENDEWRTFAGDTHCVLCPDCGEVFNGFEVADEREAMAGSDCVDKSGLDGLSDEEAYQRHRAELKEEVERRQAEEA